MFSFSVVTAIGLKRGGLAIFLTAKVYLLSTINTCMRIDRNLALVASLQFGLGSAWDCHVYAVRGSQGVVLVDSGAGVDPAGLVLEIERHWPGVPVRALLLTHAHADHSCGAEKLRRLTGCQVLAPDVSVAAIRSGDETAIGLAGAGYPPSVRLLPCPDALEYHDGVTLEVAGLRFRPIHVRGHSADSHCLLLEQDGRRSLFSGDALFYGGVLGVINQPDSGMNGYRLDLAKLEGLEVDALFPGHGLFTLRGGQRHIDLALEQSKQGFLPRQIGQWDLFF
jgi:glyoxylase-like metal-dependent hydrolase (beta-lactamase superfamily II)